ncbi:MAG: NAD(+) synthase [Holophagales bacterium]|jgi:NAD+ synthase (glutamine-hydrolysing)|nr:NAD(+) synthase [Holophagales bacterium]
MKIAMLQINACLAQPEKNSRVIEAAYLEAIRLGAALVVTPELAVPGYIPDDKLFEPNLRRAIEKENYRLQAITGSVPLVFGTCSPTGSGKLWSELWWCEHGKLRIKTRKAFLADFDSYDESRYFESAKSQQNVLDYLNKKIGLLIGENLHDSFENLIQAGVTLIVNVTASTCALGSYVPEGRNPSWALPSKSKQRCEFLSRQAKTYAAPILYINRVGADGNLLFDGDSCLTLPDGTQQCGETFNTGIFIVDTDEQGAVRIDESDDEGVWLHKALSMGIKDNLTKQSIEGVIIGLSGGVDSAVVAALAAGAICPKKILGVALPTRFTSKKSVELARQQAQLLGINYLELDADVIFASAASSLLSALPNRQFGLTDENLQSRSRGMLLLALTSEPAIHSQLGTNRCAVLNTGNKSEVAVGYFTLYGDAIGAFGVIGDLVKKRVYTLAHVSGDSIPEQVINRSPTAELRPAQTDESSLIPYRQLDAIVGALIEANRPIECVYDDLAEVLDGQDLLQARNALPRIQKLIIKSEFKRRQLPFALKVTHRGFGSGMRIPLTGIYS